MCIGKYSWNILCELSMNAWNNVEIVEDYKEEKNFCLCIVNSLNTYYEILEL